MSYIWAKRVKNSKHTTSNTRPLHTRYYYSYVLACSPKRSIQWRQSKPMYTTRTTPQEIDNGNGASKKRRSAAQKKTSHQTKQTHTCSPTSNDVRAQKLSLPYAPPPAILWCIVLMQGHATTKRGTLLDLPKESRLTCTPTPTVWVLYRPELH